MPTSFWGYESKAARRRRLADEWQARANVALFQVLARRQIQQAGYDPDAIPSLAPQITTDVSDVGEPIPPTRREKKTGGGFLSRVKDIAGDVTETVFRGPVNAPWDVLRPASQALEWEREHISDPILSMQTRVAPWRRLVPGEVERVVDVLGTAAPPPTGPARMWQATKGTPIEGLGRAVSEMAVSPSTYTPGFGLGRGVLKGLLTTPKLAPIAAKIPALSLLFRSSASLRASSLIDVGSTGGSTEKVLEGVQEIAMSPSLQMRAGAFNARSTPELLAQLRKEASTASRIRNWAGTMLPEGVTMRLRGMGVRLWDDDTVLLLQEYMRRIDRMDSLAAADGQLMRLALRGFLDKSGHRLVGSPVKVGGETFLSDLKELELLRLTPEQRAAIEVSDQPWEVMNELADLMGLVRPKLDIPGKFAHRQVTKLPAAVVSPRTGETFESMMQLGPAVRRGFRAKQAITFPRKVATQAEGVKLGVEYMPYVDSQVAGLRQLGRMINDKWLIDSLEAIGVRGMTPTELVQLSRRGIIGERTATRALLDKYQRLEAALVQYLKVPAKRGFFRPRGLADDSEFAHLLIQADTFSSLSQKPDRVEAMTTLLAAVRKRMAPVKEAATEAKAAAKEAIAGARAGGMGVYRRSFMGRLYGEIPGKELQRLNAREWGLLEKTVNRINNEIRPVMATLDTSPLGIQALFVLVRQPHNFVRALMYSTINKQAGLAYTERLEKTGQLRKFISEWGTHFYSRDDFGEFALRGLGRRIPLAGTANRFFSDICNYSRLLMVEAGESSVKTLAQGRGLARGANIATGYVPGNPSSLETAMFFAPRFFRSQLSMAGDLFTKGPLTREGQEAIKNIGTLTVVGTLFTWAVNESLGEETDWDPTSSNFLRIRALGRDISVFGPWDTFFRGVMYGVTRGPEEGAKYMVRSKASPVMARVYDLLMGETFQGEQLGADSPSEAVVSLGQLVRQWAPIGIQQAFEEGVPTTPTQIGAAAAQFTGMKAVPLTDWEKVTAERDREAQRLYSRDWADLEPYQKEEMKRANSKLAYKAQQAAWAERAELREAYAAQQEMLDEALALEEVTPREWRESYNDIRGRESGAFDEWERRHSDEAKDLIREDSKDPNYRALAQYYEAFRASRTPWGDLDSDTLDILMDQLESSWSPSQQAFVERNTGIYGTSKVQEYKRDQRKLRPYWELHEQTWQKIQQAYPKLMPYRSALDYIDAMGQKMTGSSESIQQRLAALPIITYYERLLSTLRERYRRAHPEVDAILLKWGYVSVPITQRGTPQYKPQWSLVGR